jgi:intron-binding protein aquarius
LLRNFNLFRLEAAYELRQDIEDACIRMRPYYSYEDQQVKFSSWSRMAQPIISFQIIEICKSNVGENAPSKVRADVTIDLEYLKQDIRQEWNSLRKHDIGFLISLKPSNTPEQRYNSKESFLNQMGNVTVRGCEIEGFLSEDGKLIIDEGPNGIKNKLKFENNLRTFRVFLDSNQYKSDTDKQYDIINNNDDIYSSFNVFLRRRPKESNFKSVLESIRDLMNNNFVVPDWLRDIILGYGDPAAANYKNMMQSTKKLDFNDTFLSFEHLKQSFPQYEIKVAQDDVPIEPPFKLTFQELETNISKNPILFVEPYTKLNTGPYSNNCPKVNTIKFTPTQVESIKSGMQAGLTIVVGPPGTGKTDVAVQIISNIYHNFPEQKTLIVTHSNQALNQLFEKIIALDIDERHLLRLGHGEESLETEKDFSRYGRVNFVLAKRLELLDEVEKLKNSLEDVRCDSAAYSCESASHFYVNFIQPRCEIYIDNIKKNKDLDLVEKLFPFTNFFNNAPQPLFKKVSFEKDLEIAKGCFRYITNIFKQLDEFRAFELIRNGADRAEYLLVKEAKVIILI